jgi:hypothetical protein
LPQFGVFAWAVLQSQSKSCGSLILFHNVLFVVHSKTLSFLLGLAYVKEIMIILMILNSSFDLFPPQANQSIIWIYEMIHL